MKKYGACVVGEYSDYGYYLVLAPFLPNDVSVVSRPEEISNCISRGHALVFKEDAPGVVQQVSDQGYIRSSRWHRIPSRQPVHNFIQAVQEADSSKIMQAYVTYIRMR